MRIPLKTNLLLLLLLVSIDLFSQDLYNHENSVKFGEYLYNSNQYDLATREFERAVFLKPDDQKSYLYLFKIYRKTNAFDKAIDCYGRFSGNFRFREMNREFGSEYLKLLVQRSSYKEAESFVNSNSYLNENDNFKLATILLLKDWKRADNFRQGTNTTINKSLIGITAEGAAFKRKSPALAGMLSAVLPGSGKAYAGRWKDGLIAFIMTSSTAFISVRGFNKNPNSIYPWIMGSFALVYYSGNIYGSGQAALKYNKMREDEWVDKTRAFILDDN